MKWMSSVFPLHKVAKRLLILRSLRSIGQGAMVVDLTLYLKDLHWSGISIGGVTSMAGVVGAILILFVGILSDRMGRKPFLVVFEALTILAALAASFTTLGVVLVLAIVVAGFGRGQSGAAGPFSPAEQAWLARHVEREKRGMVFSLNNAVGFIGMAVGALLGGLPALLHGAAPLTAYRPIFLLVAILSLICMVILLGTPETKAASETMRSNQGIQAASKMDGQMATSVPVTSSESALAETKILRRENIAMLKLSLVNVLNGLAVGLTGPLMAYWFSVRYGVGTAAIGATLSIGFLMTGLASLLSGALAQRFGMVKSVTWMRVIGSIMMLILPFMPTFLGASILYIFRGAINRGTQGSRTALSASLTRDKRRGLATSINALSMRLPSSIGPTLTGYMFDAGLLSLPLILTAVLQLANAGIYQWVFGRYDKA